MKFSGWYLLEKIALVFLFLGKASLLIATISSDNSIWGFLFLLLFIFSLPVYYGFLEDIIGEVKIRNLESKFIGFIEIIFGIVKLSFGAFLVFSGLGLIVYQVYFYLKKAIWKSISIIDGLDYIGFDWSENPIDWVGIWTILDKMPLSLFLIILSLFICNGFSKN